VVGVDGYPVGEVATLAHVSVRTLHHYDEIGLLRPSERTAAGHRRYTAADLQRLQQLRFYRELGFGLDEIAAILADPGVGAEEHLRRQHRLLREQIERHRSMVAAIEKEMEAREMGIALTPQEQFEIFGTDKVSTEWAEEAEQRWGETDAWKQSQRRTAAYTKQDWLEIQDEAAAITREFADTMAAGTGAAEVPAMDLAERHRQHISRWFYECGYDIHRCLGEMYVADERFAKNYEDVAAGLSTYVRDAMLANAARATG
jgi:MerR family transcriptional regulator, thiopeptide resistance regulator